LELILPQSRGYKTGGYFFIADLRAIVQMDLDLKIFRMMRLGIPQERIAKRLGLARTTMESHLTKLATLPFSPL